MTIACCWLNMAHSRVRISAIADSRASITSNAKTTPVTDDTVKLLPLMVRCHQTSDFSPEFERFINPYFETELGIAYSGDCFSAFNIIALFSRALAQLASDTWGAQPEAAGIADALRVLTDAFFNKADGPTAASTVHFLLFGYEPGTGKPWVAELKRTSPDKTALSFHGAIGVHDFFCIGDGTNAHNFSQTVRDLENRIRKHAAELVSDRGDEAEFRLLTEQAKHEVAYKKVVESQTIHLIESTFIDSVGGELQKLEIYPDGASGLACQSTGLGYHILRHLPVIAPGLVFPTVSELMGRGRR